MSKIKVCAYCRVSTDSNDQKNSFENQQTYFNRELSRNPDLELIDIYADKGISGTKLHRTEFDKMLVDAGLDIIEVKSSNSEHTKYITMPSNREPRFNYIYVKNTSRFARNIEVESIFRDLAKKKVYVKFLDLDKSTENDADITYIQIFNSFDERESRDKRTKVLFGFEEGNKKGVIRTNGKIYGYRYIKEENRLEIIESEAEIIRKIFGLYSEEYGIRKILNYLEEHNIRTRNGKPFVKSTISKILDNEKYCGLRNNMKHKLGNDLFDKFTSPKRKSDDEYIVDESDKIPAIITKELFYKCREIRYSKKNREKQLGLRKAASKYGGKVWCASCGEPYISNVDRGRKFYNCKTKKNFGTKKCNNSNVSQMILDRELKKYFEFIKEDDFTVRITNRIFAMCRIIIEHEDFNENKLIELKQRETELIDELKELYSLYSKKQNQEVLKSVIEEKEAIISNIKKKITELSDKDNSVINKILECYSFINTISDIYAKMESEEDILEYVRFLILPDGRIETDLEIYFEFWNLFAHTSEIAYDALNDEEMNKEYNSYLDDINTTKTIVEAFIKKYAWCCTITY